MVRDLVCGELVEVSHALRVSYHGRVYYFCSHDCKANFEDRPDEYARPVHHLLGGIVTYPFETLVSAIRSGETQR